MRKRLLHIILSLLTLTVAQTARAQYYSVNIDVKTVAAMVAAYGAETATELFYDEQVQEILKHYKAAEVAAAGIFSSKYLDRKALTELGIWGDATENYYYRRIYNMVASKIMPKIWTVAGMMLKSPQNALYWGSYLMKVCDDTKSLCMQFESIVTNSTLSFKDIAFLEINERVAGILRLSELGGVDFKAVLDNFSDIGAHFTKENLKADLDNLYQQGINLASAGVGNLLQTSNFNDLFQGKLGAAITIADNYASLFQSFENNAGATLLGLIGGPDALGNLFNLSNYNMTSWIDDYAREGMGQYYRQRWYIYYRDAGSETLCSYTPPTDRDAILDGSHWYRINTSDQNFYPSSSQREAILQNSENHAGWSRSRVSQLNNAHDGNTYSFSSYMQAYLINSSSGQLKKKAYAYQITVTKSWNNSEEVYEDYFDSYTMDLATFQAQMNVKLAAFNDNEEGKQYYIGKDSKNYYQTTDAKKLEGIETVTISVTCHDGATLGEGSTQYKCSSCGKSLSEHTKQCAMATSIPSSGDELSQLEAMKSDLQAQIDALNSRIAALQSENDRLIREIASSSVEQAAALRQQYNANKDKIEQLQSELASLQSQMRDIDNAIDEAVSGENVATDDYNRIPSIMQSLQNAYHLTWQDAGSWSGYTFTRHAAVPNIQGVVTFTAKLTMARKASYFLGIRIHRAIIQIDWKLAAQFSTTNVIEVLTLDPGMDAGEKAKLVNDKIAEVARQYPNCTVNTEYARTEPVQEDDSEDKYHLLWSSDRLEIAREIDSRLTKIYADLVSLEKMMHYKYDIIDFLRDVASGINTDEGRKLSIIEECHKRWMDNARMRDSEGGDEGGSHNKGTIDDPIKTRP